MTGMILVFKTTVTKNSEVKKLKVHLDALLPTSKWNFDLANCDNILRVDTAENKSGLIIHTMNENGFDCIELE